MATHAGMTTVEFERIVKDWIATAKHPKTGKLFTEMTYEPMLELLAYLRANGFKNFIVSGGGIEFMRPWAERVYGIPPEQVIGSSIKTKFEMRDGKPVLVRLPQLNFNDDKADKPVGINQHIGRRPIAAFGNSTGDQQMLEYTQGGSGARFELLVLHDDAAREYAYGPALGLPAPKLGPFTPALYDEAKKEGWTVVSMKDDWKQVFPFEQNPVTAIDILLTPDATMLQRAEANNARLLKVFPKGFALDATHRPHITMIQRFVRTADLDSVYATVGKVLAGANVNGMKLEAFKYYYIPSGKTGLAGIVAKPPSNGTIGHNRSIDQRAGTCRNLTLPPSSRWPESTRRAGARRCISARLLNYLVGSQQHRLRNGKTERLRGFQVDDQFELGWLLNWKITGLRALENLVDVLSRRAMKRREVRTEGHETALVHELPILI